MNEARGLIIGYGNSLRGDDAIGVHVADVLAHRIDFARVLSRHQLTVELADDIARAPWVIFVDATAEEPAGNICVHPLDPDRFLPRMFSHHMAPAALLACAQEFFGSAPPAWLFTVGAESLDAELNLHLDGAAIQKIASEVANFARELERNHAYTAQ